MTLKHRIMLTLDEQIWQRNAKMTEFVLTHSLRAYAFSSCLRILFVLTHSLRAYAFSSCLRILPNCHDLSDVWMMKESGR